MAVSRICSAVALLRLSFSSGDESRSGDPCVSETSDPSFDDLNTFNKLPEPDRHVKKNVERVQFRLLPFRACGRISYRGRE